MTDLFRPYSSRFLHSSGKVDFPRYTPPATASPTTSPGAASMKGPPSTRTRGNAPASSSSSARVTRKRAASINAEEASSTRMEGLSITTPASSEYHNEPTPEPICLCTPPPKIPRPRNAFILYRQHHQKEVVNQNPGLPNPTISKIIGEQWQKEPDKVKNYWKKQAEKDKLLHQQQYPNYRYQPRRGGKNSRNRPPGPASDDSGRCLKCGGRNIATPRTPSTPSSAGQAQGMPLPPVPGSADGDHTRGPGLGAVAAGMANPPSQHGFQPGGGLREMGESYEPRPSSPDSKRRRVTAAGGYQPTHAITTGQTGRPVPHHGRHASLSATAISPHPYGQQPFPAPGVMAPPPRPQAYAFGSSPARGPSFDESLRLPPLQTHATQSPPMASAGSRLVSPAGVVAVSAGTDSHAGDLETMMMSIPYINKIEALCNISPALRAPHPGSPKTDTRGAFIAVEGPHHEMLPEVAAVIERALRDSQEVALEKWGDDDVTLSIAGTRAGSWDTQAESWGPHMEVSRQCMSYLGKTVKWHQWSNEIIRHITTHPEPAADEAEMDVERASSDGGGVSAGGRKSAAGKDTTSPASRVPIALVPSGFSLTWADRFACAIPIADTYAPVDHWMWMATFWRGIIGPDLFVYVKPSSEEEIRNMGSVEAKSEGIMVVRVREGRGMDEKTERRLAFEIVEWVRGGTYKQLSG